jgi:fucose permease
MADNREVVAVYAAGIAQGTALVTFPAVGTILTGQHGYALSPAQYGTLFVPQVICAIGASFFGPQLTRRLGIKATFLLGLAADAVSMALLLASWFAVTNTTPAYLMLLLATTSLGLGFGLTVPALNTLAAAMFPRDNDRAILVLNALLGVGTVLAPALVALFVGLRFWWGLPLLAALLAVVLIVFSLPLAFVHAASGRTQLRDTRLPLRFWVYAAAALLYGIVETTNGNWAEIVMSGTLSASATLASLALSAFWAAVTAGRLLFGAIEAWLPARWTYRILPFICAIALLVTAWLRPGDGIAGVFTFALAGLGCSALLPLTISFAQEELRSIAATVAGPLIAFYQIGYGIAAFGVAHLQGTAGAALSGIFTLGATIAAALGILSFVVVQRPRHHNQQLPGG